MKPELLTRRAHVLRAIRHFFDERGYLEIDTPIRVATPAMELHIDAIPAGNEWLRTSPELHMKRLLAAGFDRIYQIGSCFRHGERGDRHNPEFTMLEWYEAAGDYRTILMVTCELLAELGAIPHRESVTVITVAEAFLEHAGWDPSDPEAFDPNRFDEDLVEKVEPALPQEGAVVLIDYPAELGALARLSPLNPNVAERWELYLHGVELANAYSELTDVAEQRRRFEAWGNARANRGATVYPLDEPFLTDLAHMPDAGGIALGIDRLLMALCPEAECIADVRGFVE